MIATPDAAADVHGVPVVFDGVTQRFHDALAHCGTSMSLPGVEQDEKLIAAEPAHGILGAQKRGYALPGHL